MRKTDSYRVTQFVEKSFVLMHSTIVTAGPQAVGVKNYSTVCVLQTRYIERWCVTNEIYRQMLFAVSPTFDNISGRKSVLPFLVIRAVCYLLYKNGKK